MDGRICFAAGQRGHGFALRPQGHRQEVLSWRAAVGFCLRGITLLGGAVSPTTTTASTGSSTTPTPSPTAKGNVIFTNGNTGGVYNNPSRATTFTLQARPT